MRRGYGLPRMEPPDGLEPPTFGLQIRCSTNCSYDGNYNPRARCRPGDFNQQIYPPKVSVSIGSRMCATESSVHVSF